MDLYEAIAQLQHASKALATQIEEEEDASSWDIDQLDEAISIADDFLKLLRGAK